MVSIFQHPFYPTAAPTTRRPTWSTCRSRPARAATCSARSCPTSGCRRCATTPPEMSSSRRVSTPTTGRHGFPGAGRGRLHLGDRQLKKVAAEFAGRRIVSMLEGGYSCRRWPEALSRTSSPSPTSVPVRPARRERLFRPRFPGSGPCFGNSNLRPSILPEVIGYNILLSSPDSP